MFGLATVDCSFQYNILNYCNHMNGNVNIDETSPQRQPDMNIHTALLSTQQQGQVTIAESNQDYKRYRIESFFLSLFSTAAMAVCTEKRRHFMDESSSFLDVNRPCRGKTTI